jgi:HK97 family phage prohead protease
MTHARPKPVQAPMQALDVPFAIKSVARARDADGAGLFEGIAATFNRGDRAGDIVLPGAFGRLDSGRVRLLWQHRPDQPIGVWEELRETPEGLFVRGRLLLDVQQGREAHALLKAGAVDALSIGFTVPPGGAELEAATGLRRLKRIELWEVSIVTFPADQEARIRRVRTAPVPPAARGLAEEIRRLARCLRRGA